MLLSPLLLPLCLEKGATEGTRDLKMRQQREQKHPTAVRHHVTRKSTTDTAAAGVLGLLQDLSPPYRKLTGLPPTTL